MSQILSNLSSKIVTLSLTSHDHSEQVMGILTELDSQFITIQLGVIQDIPITTYSDHNMSDRQVHIFKMSSEYASYNLSYVYCIKECLDTFSMIVKPDTRVVLSDDKGNCREYVNGGCYVV